LSNKVEAGIVSFHPSLHSRFRRELEQVASRFADLESVDVAAIQAAMLAVANGSLDRLLLAREPVESDWRNFVARAGSEPSAVVADGYETSATWGRRRREVRGEVAAKLSSGASVFLEFGDGAANFVTPADGIVTGVPPDAWLETTEVPDDDPNGPESVIPGDYGDLIAAQGRVAYDPHGSAELWRPGGFHVTRDQKWFRLRTKKGFAADSSNDIEVRSVLANQNLATRFAREGYLLVAGGSAVGFLTGLSLEEWVAAR